MTIYTPIPDDQESGDDILGHVLYYSEMNAKEQKGKRRDYILNLSPCTEGAETILDAKNAKIEVLRDHVKELRMQNAALREERQATFQAIMDFIIQYDIPLEIGENESAVHALLNYIRKIR